MVQSRTDGVSTRVRRDPWLPPDPKLEQVPCEQAVDMCPELQPHHQHTPARARQHHTHPGQWAPIMCSEL